MSSLKMLSRCGSLLLMSFMMMVNMQAAPKKKVLYLTQTLGFHHQITEESETILKQLGEKVGFELTATKDSAQINAANLENFDAVVFYTTGELPFSDEQKTALLNFVKSGKGFVGIHNATDTCYKWTEYGDLIGAYFDGHPWTQEVTIKVEDTQHPSTRHLGQSFQIWDEIYQYKDWSRDKVHVLLSLDNSSVDLKKPGVKRTDKDFAIAWTKDYGKGRVFFTGLGHDEHTWRDPRYQQHLANGILWSMRAIK